MNLLDGTKAALKTIWQFKIKNKPFILSHEINSRCNLKCDFCKSWRQNKNELSKEEIYKIIDQAKEFGITIYNLWGTEPLLRKDIKEIVDYSKEKKLITSLVTNGSLLKDKANEISNIDYLTVSLDGIETQKKIRGISYSEVMEGIKKAKSLDIEVGINCVINKKNLKEIPELVNECKKNDLPITLEPVHKNTEISKEKWRNYSLKESNQYKDIINNLINMKKDGYPIINSKTYLNTIRDLNKKIKCENKLPIIHLNSEGKLKMCRVKDKELNSEETELRKKWTKSKKKRNKIAKKCDGCQFFGYVESKYINQLKLEPIKNVFKFL